MICEKCKAQGLKSKIFTLPSNSALTSNMVDNNYYDENGVYHSHNFISRAYTISYICSNGHRFDEKISCCGIPSEKEIAHFEDTIVNSTKPVIEEVD